MEDFTAIVQFASELSTIGILLVSLRYVDNLRQQERDRANRNERRLLRFLAGDFMREIEDEEGDPALLPD